MSCIFMSLSSVRCPAYSCPYRQQDVLHMHVLTVREMSCIFMSLRQQDVLHTHVLTLSKMPCIFMSLPSARCPAYSCPYRQQDVLHIHVLTVSKMYCIFLSLPSARCPAYSCPYRQQDVLHTHFLTVSKMSCLFKVNTFLFACLFVRLAFCCCLFLSFFKAKCQTACVMVSTLPPATHVQPKESLPSARCPTYSK